MTASASLLIGALLGAANAAAAVWTARRAERLGANAALGLVLGSMAARMGLALVAFGAVLVFVPVHRTAFVAGLGVTFAVGLAAEVALVWSSARPDA